MQRLPTRHFSLRTVFALALVAAATVWAGCRKSETSAYSSGGAPSAFPANPAAAEVPTYTYEVVNVWPHDRGAFTEGLIYLKGIYLESTGLNGQSTLRKVDAQTGRTLQQVALSSQYFGEGMTVLGEKIYQLTWKNQKGFIYDLSTLQLEREFAYTGEGWGLTNDGHSLIMSDGSHRIRFVDPTTFAVTRTIEVFNRGQPLKDLNELEYIKGELFANIWQTDLIARIDPATGKLLGLINLAGLLSPSDYGTGVDVLNGIAYDPSGDRILVTGKNWPKIFEIRLRPK